MALREVGSSKLEICPEMHTTTKVAKMAKFRQQQLGGQCKCKGGHFKKFGESGKSGKLVKIADNNLEANANDKARGPPCKAGEFGESGKLVKIADNNLEANANEKTRGPACKAGEFGEF